MEGRSYERYSDEEVVRLCTEQLPYVTAAFEEILRRYEPVVLRTCHRYLGDSQEAEEACQDIFLRIFNKVAQFEERSSFRTWLYRIVFNVCSSRHRKLQKRSRHEVIGGELSQKKASNGPMATSLLVGSTAAPMETKPKRIAEMTIKVRLSWLVLLIVISLRWNSFIIIRRLT